MSSNADTGSAQPPASNPGSDDPTAGIAAGNGGVSGSAYIRSPVQNEQRSIAQSTVDTVRNIIGGLGLSGSKTGQQEGGSAEEEKTAESSDAAGAAAGAGAAATAAAGTAAAASSTGDNKETSASNVRSRTMPTDSAVPTQGKAVKTEMIANSVQQNEESDKKPEVEQSGGGQQTDEEKVEKSQEEIKEKVERPSVTEEKKKDMGGKEHEDAIPSAGGEKLGGAHWGESKKVPDVPKTESDQQVSSEEGQPDSMFNANRNKFLASSTS